MAKTTYLKAFLTGMASITLPTFYNNVKIPKIPEQKLSDSQKLSVDYRLSLDGIKKEAREFESRRK